MALEEYFFRNKAKTGDLYSMHRDLFWKLRNNMLKLRRRYCQEAVPPSQLQLQRFAVFLIELPRFIVITGDKPLLVRLNSKRLELTPRIQRFYVRLMRFSCNITCSAGKNLIVYLRVVYLNMISYVRQTEMCLFAQSLEICQ